MEELQQISFENRGLVQSTLRVESRDLQHILAETGKALAYLQERYTVLEENQKILEENQKMLLQENQRLRDQLEKVAAAPAPAAPAASGGSDRVLQLFELNPQEVEASMTAEPNRRLALLHRAPAFTFLIKRFNNMVDNFNLLNGKLAQVENVVQTMADPRHAAVPHDAGERPLGSERVVIRRPGLDGHDTGPGGHGRPGDGLGDEDAVLGIQRRPEVSSARRVEEVGDDAEGRGRRPYLGVEVGEAGDGDGLRIVSVKPDSAAARAGLLVGDALLTFSDTDVTSRDVFRALLRSCTPGQVVPIVFARKAIRMKSTLIVGAQETAEADRMAHSAVDDRPRGPPSAPGEERLRGGNRVMY